MEIKIPRETAEAMKAVLKPFGVDTDSDRWTNMFFISLHTLEAKSRLRLRDVLEKNLAAKGVKTALNNMALWDKALASGGAGSIPRTVKQFESMLRVYLGAAPRHHLYNKEDSGVWQAYYVAKTSYTKEERHGRGEEMYISPAHADAYLVYRELGDLKKTHVTWNAHDIFGKTVPAALADKGYYTETPTLRAEHEARHKIWLSRFNHVGLQLHATGLADELDNNNDSWWHRHTQIVMDRGGDPSRVVVDVLSESEDERETRVSKVDKMWWYAKRIAKGEDEDEEDMSGAPDADDVPEPEIPVSPLLVCYDMRRHARISINSGQLLPYKYDNRLNEKLILPDDSRNLVEMLLGHKSHFKDIVHAKSGGAIILCSGIPGTGKTLTAEVYAEVMSRPLYTVQASQLGTNPETLEAELLKMFARAERWKAILLLDEADVYVRQRGNDLTQNAIVGVFLRVLEYYKGVLFLTTNREDLVDDAIASRCIAHIRYKEPSQENQRLIWRVLADSASIEIGADVIAKVSDMYPNLTGRDVKNLLKLAKLVSDTRECAITVDIIRFVKRFKPTIGTKGEEVDTEPISLPPIPERVEEPVADDVPLASGDAAATESAALGQEPKPVSDWRSVATSVFDDGAPHSAQEVKEAVTKFDASVHPNAVTMHLVSLSKQSRLVRLTSGLYRKEG